MVVVMWTGRFIRLGLRGLVVLALLLPLGCQALVGMAVKHVAMSVAKDVAKDQYKQAKARDEAAQKARNRSLQAASTRPAGTADGDSSGKAEP